MDSVEIPGFINIADPAARRHTKLFWGGVLTVCLGLTAYHCTNTIMNFINSPSTSTMYVEHKFEVQLPQMMFQSTTSWNFSKLRQDGFDERLFPTLIEALFARQLAPGVQAPSPDIEWPDRFKNMDKFDFIIEYGIGCRDTLIYCSFNFEIFNCCDKAVPYWHLIYGTSYVLKDLQNQSRINSRDGLFIIFRWDNQMYEEFRHIAVAPHYMSYRLDVGDDFTFPPVDSTLLPLGMFTHVKIMPKITRRIKGFWVDCVDDVSSYDPAEVYRDICPAITYANMCNCVALGYVDRNSSKPVCDPRTMGACIQGNFSAMYNACDSPTSHPMDMCETKQYQTSFSSASLEPYSVAAQIGENVSSINISNYAVAFIQYTLIGDTIEEIRDSVSPPGFIAMLGGELGLWLGCSIVSLIQMVIFLGDKIRKYCCKTKDSARASKAAPMFPGTDGTVPAGQDSGPGFWAKFGTVLLPRPRLIKSPPFPSHPVGNTNRDDHSSSFLSAASIPSSNIFPSQS